MSCSSSKLNLPQELHFGSKGFEAVIRRAHGSTHATGQGRFIRCPPGIGGHSRNSITWRPLDDMLTMAPSSFYAGAIESA